VFFDLGYMETFCRRPPKQIKDNLNSIIEEQFTVDWMDGWMDGWMDWLVG